LGSVEKPKDRASNGQRPTCENIVPAWMLQIFEKRYVYANRTRRMPRERASVYANDHFKCADRSSASLLMRWARLHARRDLMHRAE
jgi:hypothetical protein